MANERQRAADIPDLDPINQLENIHAHQNLGTHNQHISQRDLGPPGVRIIQHCIAKCDINKRIHGDHQYDQLGSSRYMMVHKAPPIGIIQLCVFGAIKTFEQEGFDDVLFQEEENDEDDGEGEGGVGG